MGIPGNGNRGTRPSRICIQNVLSYVKLLCRVGVLNIHPRYVGSHVHSFGAGCEAREAQIDAEHIVFAKY